MIGKITALQRLSNSDGIIAALAIDQRGSLKKMLAKKADHPVTSSDLSEFKKVISQKKWQRIHRRSYSIQNMVYPLL